MRGLFQFSVAAWFIAILSLVGLRVDGAMAQSAPQLLFAKLGSTAITAEPVPAPTSLVEPSEYTLANRSSETSLPNGGFSAISNIPTSNPIALRSAPNIPLSTEIMKGSALGPVRRASSDVFSTFIVAYNSLRKSLAVRAKSLIQKYAALTPAFVGVASTYNPYLDGNGSDDKQTASGEPYDPAAWTAAIRIDLRKQFGGVRYGRNYRPTFALVESGEKCVIVKINDVGPLGPGRVIDLNERSMRYFDPTQQLGLIGDVKVTLLRHDNWTPGPIASESSAIAQ